MPRVRASAADLERRSKESPDDRARATAQMVMDYHATFGTISGQRVLADLIRRSGYMGTSFVPGQADMTAYREGMRVMGLHLVETLARQSGAVVALARSGDVEELFKHE